jgi:hypothetical protein
MILKCTECGNTFSKEKGPANDDIVACPICEAQYRAVITEGKLRLVDFVFDDEKDLGEL